MCAAVTLVLGGASSGKSNIAENLCLNSELRLIYLASAQAYDEEMRTKVEQHRTRRSQRWTTIEDPFGAPEVIAAQNSETCVLFDCATLWLTNHLLADHDIIAQIDALCSALRKTAAKVVIVSNETGQGIVPENALARRFRIEQGQLNQRLAQVADQVVGVMAGLPFALKGPLPEGIS